jgi:predicted O-methyltransferase YrrM
MQERKLKIGVARFPYAGNGGTEAEHPSIADWLVKTTLKIKDDPRCEEGIWPFRKADTPIPMVRNEALKGAVDNGVDVLVMIDSDQIPDLHLGTDPEAKPFWDTSFDFLWKHWDKGPCCIGAPYCGGFPHPIKGGITNPYIFQWCAFEDDPARRTVSLEQYSREEAARQVGIQEVAALPTGLYMIDTRVTKIVKPEWFYYEWKDPPYNTQKASTEDVVFTRDASLSGVPQFCNWDAWAGHVKPRISGKPIMMSIDDVGEKLRTSLVTGWKREDRITELRAGEDTSDVLRELQKGAVQSPPVLLEPTRHGGLRTDKEKFQIVTRKYGLDLFELSQTNTLMGNTADDDVETVRDLVKVLVSENPHRPLEILEIGTWAGHTACAMHDALGPQGGTIYCVDTWKGGPGDVCELNAKLYGSENVKAIFDRNREGRQIHAFQMTSEQAATHERSLPEQFDLIYIDAEHTREAVKQDCDLWLPRVRSGGFIAGHDYDQGLFPGVVEEINDRFPSGYTKGVVWWQPVGEAAISEAMPTAESTSPADGNGESEQSGTLQDRFTPGERGSLELKMRRGETMSMMMERLQGEVEGGRIAEGQAVVIKQPEVTAV